MSGLKAEEVSALLTLAVADGALSGLLAREEDLPAERREGPGKHLLALLEALDREGGPPAVLEAAARLLDAASARGSRSGKLSARGTPPRSVSPFHMGGPVLHGDLSPTTGTPPSPPRTPRKGGG